MLTRGRTSRRMGLNQVFYSTTGRSERERKRETGKEIVGPARICPKTSRFSFFCCPSGRRGLARFLCSRLSAFFPTFRARSLWSSSSSSSLTLIHTDPRSRASSFTRTTRDHHRKSERRITSLCFRSSSSCVLTSRFFSCKDKRARRTGSRRR